MDDWYALQVITGRERDVAAMLCRNGIQAFAPDVQRLERKRGEWTLVTRRAIPGYVFVRCQMTIPLYYHLVRKPGVIKLLGMCSDRYTAIPEEQVNWIEALRIACGEQPDRASRAVQGTDGEIEIVDGPLLAIKDRVTKIDAHRRRATVTIELYDDTYNIDLAVEVEKHPESPAG